MKKKMINIHNLDKIIATFKYYVAANQFKKITSLTQNDIDAHGYKITLNADHGYSKQEVLRQTVQFVYMMLTDFYVDVNLAKKNYSFEIKFDTKIKPNEILQIDLLTKESMDKYLERKRYKSIGNIEFQKYYHAHPSACIKLKYKKSETLECLSPKVVDFLATFPIIFYLNDNEHEKYIDICSKIDTLANKYFSEHIISCFRTPKTVKKLLDHCQEVLENDNEMREIEVTFEDNKKETVCFNNQLAEDIYYSIIYTLVEKIQTLNEIDINKTLDSKISNDKAGYRRINKYFFSMQHKHIEKHLNSIDLRKEEMKKLQILIMSGKKFF